MHDFSPVIILIIFSSIVLKNNHHLMFLNNLYNFNISKRMVRLIILTTNKKNLKISQQYYFKYILFVDA